MSNRLLDVKTTTELLKAAGIRGISKSSVGKMSEYYRDIIVAVYNKIISSSDLPITDVTVRKALRKLKEPLLQNVDMSRRSPIQCKPFTKRREDYSNVYSYRTAKINFYNRLRHCVLNSHRKFVERVSYIVDTSDFTTQAMFVFHKAVDQFFKRYLQVLAYKAITNNNTITSAISRDSFRQLRLEQNPTARQPTNIDTSTTESQVDIPKSPISIDLNTVITEKIGKESGSTLETSNIIDLSEQADLETSNIIDLSEQADLETIEQTKPDLTTESELIKPLQGDLTTESELIKPLPGDLTTESELIKPLPGDLTTETEVTKRDPRKTTEPLKPLQGDLTTGSSPDDLSMETAEPDDSSITNPTKFSPDDLSTETKPLPDDLSTETAEPDDSSITDPTKSSLDNLSTETKPLPDDLSTQTTDPDDSDDLSTETKPLPDDLSTQTTEPDDSDDLSTETKPLPDDLSTQTTEPNDSDDLSTETKPLPDDLSTQTTEPNDQSTNPFPDDISTGTLPEPLPDDLTEITEPVKPLP